MSKIVTELFGEECGPFDLDAIDGLNEMCLYVLTKGMKQAFRNENAKVDQVEVLLQKHPGKWDCHQSKYCGIDISSEGSHVLTANYADYSTCAALCDLVNRFRKLSPEARKAE